MGKTEETLTTRQNAVTALRLGLALTVVVSHAYGLVGPEPEIGGYTVGTLAVVGFFGLSGYLVASSYERSRSTLVYLASRALRILPGYYLSLAFAAFIIAPLLVVTTHMSWAGYFGGSQSAVSFFFGNAIGHGPVGYEQMMIAGLPQTLQVGLDSPLWTLGHEVACYVALVLILALLPRLWAKRFAAGTVLLLALAQLAVPVENWLFGGTPLDFLGLYDPRVTLFALAFFVSVCLWLWRIPLSPDAALLGVAFLVLLLVFGETGSWWAVSLALIGPYLLLTLAAATPRLALSTDLSYGVYVLAWPVQQLFATLGWGLFGTLGVSLALVVPLALASWRLVERPALSLKGPVSIRLAQWEVFLRRASRALLTAPHSRADARAARQTHLVAHSAPSQD